MTMFIHIIYLTYQVVAVVVVWIIYEQDSPHRISERDFYYSVAVTEVSSQYTVYGSGKSCTIPDWGATLKLATLIFFTYKFLQWFICVAESLSYKPELFKGIWSHVYENEKILILLLSKHMISTI